jgi:tRNA modification GTPase
MARTQRAFDQADKILWVMDASRPFSDDDARVAKLIAGKNVVAALNKSDLLPAEQQNPASAAVRAAERTARNSFGNDLPCALTSALTGRGLNDLRLALLGDRAAPAEAPPVPTIINARHEDLLRQALAAMEETKRDAEKGLGDECLALSLRKSLEAMDQITGEKTDDDILDSIFSKFCIGK